MVEHDEKDHLPLMEKINHGSWKIRLMGYEELKKLLKGGLEIENVDELIKKAVEETNVIAQEAAFETISTFLEKSNDEINVIDELLPALIVKGLGASKMGIKKHAQNCILNMTSLGYHEKVLDGLIGTLSSKQHKLVSSSIRTIKVIIEEFGAKAIGLEQIYKYIPQMYLNPSPVVREDTTNLCIEISKWVGEEVINILDGKLKPIIIKDLKERLSKSDIQDKTPVKFIRSNLKINENGDKAIQKDYDHKELKKVEEKDIMAKIVKYLKDINSKSWKEAKNGLEKLHNELKITERIADANYNTLVLLLVKKLNDTNVCILIGSLNCIEALAKGYGSRFAVFISICIPPIILKLKERKEIVAIALKRALNTIFLCDRNLNKFFEYYMQGFQSINPNVKAETLNWFRESLKKAKIPLSQNLKEKLIEAVFKLTTDGSPDVRDAAFYVWNDLKSHYHEDYILNKYEYKMSSAQKRRLNELDNQKSETLVQLKPKSDNKKNLNSKIIKKENYNDEIVHSPQIKKVTGQKMKIGIGSPELIKKTSFSINEEKLEEEANMLLGELAKKLKNGTRIDKINAMKDIKEQIITYNDSSEIIVKYLSIYPGFKYLDFQVVRLLIDIIEKFLDLASNEKRVNIAQIILESDFLSRVADPKLKLPIISLLDRIRDICNINITCKAISDATNRIKNIKAIEYLLLWLKESIEKVEKIITNNCKETVSQYILLGKKYLFSSNGNIRANSATYLKALSEKIPADLLIATFGDFSNSLALSVKNHWLQKPSLNNNNEITKKKCDKLLEVKKKQEVNLKDDFNIKLDELFDNIKNNYTNGTIILTKVLNLVEENELKESIQIQKLIEIAIIGISNLRSSINQKFLAKKLFKLVLDKGELIEENLGIKIGVLENDKNLKSHIKTELNMWLIENIKKLDDEKLKNLLINEEIAKKVSNILNLKNSTSNNTLCLRVKNILNNLNNYPVNEICKVLERVSVDYEDLPQKKIYNVEEIKEILYQYEKSNRCLDSKNSQPIIESLCETLNCKDPKLRKEASGIIFGRLLRVFPGSKLFHPYIIKIMKSSNINAKKEILSAILEFLENQMGDLTLIAGTSAIELAASIAEIYIKEEDDKMKNKAYNILKLCLGDGKRKIPTKIIINNFQNFTQAQIEKIEEDLALTPTFNGFKRLRNKSPFNKNSNNLLKDDIQDSPLSKRIISDNFERAEFWNEEIYQSPNIIKDFEKFESMTIPDVSNLWEVTENVEEKEKKLTIMLIEQKISSNNTATALEGLKLLKETRFGQEVQDLITKRISSCDFEDQLLDSLLQTQQKFLKDNLYAKSISINTIKDLIMALLKNLQKISNRENLEANAKNLIRRLNMVLLTLLENSKIQNSFSALLELLSENINDLNNLDFDQESKKLQSYLIKCLWRLTNLMHKYDPEKMNILLGDMDRFFKNIPKNLWRDYQSKISKELEISMRTVRAIIKEAVSVAGPFLDTLGKEIFHNDWDNSILSQYIKFEINGLEKNMKRN